MMDAHKVLILCLSPSFLSVGEAAGYRGKSQSFVEVEGGRSEVINPTLLGLYL